MQPDPAKPEADAEGGPGSAPLDEAARKRAERETLAATSSSLSSFGGLAGSSFGWSVPATSGVSGSGQTIQVGQTFGRYQILKVLGSGSMGSVFLAHDVQLDRQVALKMPRMEQDASGSLSLRFHREARAAAVLNHPNICPIYDVGEHAGTCFIAMGYVEAKPLSAYIESKKRQSERESAKVVRKVALALHEAHGHGVLHRDLKPTNIMIDKRGEPIVMDFGVACWFDDQTQTRLTQAGTLIGTPAYMSPEQIQGRTKLGPTSDVYSLGVVLYQLLTGRCPFEGTVVNLIGQVLHDEPPAMGSFRPDLSPAIVEIGRRAMQKDPAQRYATMKEFAKALTTFLNEGTAGDQSTVQTARGTKASPPPAKDEANTAEDPWPDVSDLPGTIEFPAPGLGLATRPRQVPVLPHSLNRKPAKKKGEKTWMMPVIVGVSAATLVIVGAIAGPMIISKQSAVQVASRDQTTDSGAEQAARHPVAQAASGQPTQTADALASQKTPLPRPPVLQPNAASTETTVVVTRPDGVVVPGRLAVSKTASAPVVTNGGSSPTSPTPVNPVTPPSTQANVPGALREPATADGPPASRKFVPPVAVAKDEADEPARRPADDRKPAARGQRRAQRPEQPNGGPPLGPNGQPPPGDRGPQKGTTIEQYFQEHDSNDDKQLDPSELPMHVIARADTDKDGMLSLHELQMAYKRRGQKLFTRPTSAEMRRLPRPPGPGGGPGPPNGPNSSDRPRPPQL